MSRNNFVIKNADSSLDFSEDEFVFKVVMVGAVEAGKTTLCHRIVENIFRDHYKATIGRY